MKRETFENFSNESLDELKDWINTLNLKGKTPRGQKKNKENLVFIQNQLELNEMFGDSSLCFNNIMATISRFTYEDIEEINEKFSDRNKGIFKTKNIEVVNNSSMSEKAFKEFALEISKMINSVGALHKPVSRDGVKIVVVNKSEQKAPGKYKSNLDEIWVHPNLKVDNELYGNGKFIVMHELGHKYEYMYGLPSDFDDRRFETTDYSKVIVDFGGSESFAEIFAVSNWKENYPNYNSQIEEFSKLMIEHNKNNAHKRKREIPKIARFLG